MIDAKENLGSHFSSSQVEKERKGYVYIYIYNLENDSIDAWWSSKAEYDSSIIMLET